MANFNTFRKVEDRGLAPYQNLIVIKQADAKSDLPDVTELQEPNIFEIRSGNLAPDLIAPYHTDGSDPFDEYRSLIDGSRI